MTVIVTMKAKVIDQIIHKDLRQQMIENMAKFPNFHFCPII